MAISHRITHIESGVTTERCTADAIRPGDVLVFDTDRPADERGQSVVISCDGMSTDRIRFTISPVLAATETAPFDLGPDVWVHRIFSARS